ncbi:hypothetical protein RB595_008418 [Gaeumannomyces hyphopodioides]
MAAPPFDNPLPSLSHNPLFFDIYTDGAVAVPAPILPGGPCGFVDLTPGANGARCGCRRFWSRPPSAAQVRAFLESPGPDQAYWCMCSHHACYHEDSQAAQTPVVAPAAATPSAVFAAGQENERPKGGREPLTPVQDLVPFQMPSTTAGLGMSMDLPGFELGGPSFTTAAMDYAPGAFASPCDGHGTNHPPISAHHQAPPASLPDTLVWGNAPQSNNGALSGLPPIPSQCLMSQSPSTTPSSQLRYLRPFAGKGLHTLKGKELAEPKAPAGDVNRPHGSSPIDPDTTIPNTQASPQEHITMPTAPTPKGAWSQSFSARPQHSPPGLDHEAVRGLKDALCGHGQRLDKLENPSFSIAGHEDCGDRHDHTDLRVTELETRVEEVEKRLNDDNSTVVSMRREDGNASVISESTHALSDRQVYSQLQELQAQVNRLQASSLPTYNSPWELEVVILPFCLKGVWMPAHEFQSQRPSGAAPWDANGDEWTQMPNTLSRQTPDPTSPYMVDWLDQSSSSTWLLPRACAPGRVIDNRLRSRGLIKTLSVKGSDARSVHLAVVDAFNNVLQILATGAATHPSSRLAGAKPDRFLGLSQPWVPLRKLHKDSRLRFLSPAEMLTPTLWDVGFLSSSVVMKATGMHRLYITQPEAYLQDQQVGRDGAWSWQRLRELGRVCPDSQSSSASTVDASFEAHEECWQWHDRLDEPPAAPSPELNIQEGQGAAAVVVNKSRSTAASSSQAFFTAESLNAARGKSPALSRDQRKGSRPPHVRTTSVPAGGVPVVSSPGSGSQPRKARGLSYTSASKSSQHERRPSPFVPGPSRPSPRLQMVSAMVSKRRRSGGGASGAGRSPSVRQRNTPRWSTVSFSRSPSVLPRDMSAAPEDQRMRGTTPFCYATPYSTAPAEGPRGGDYAGRAVSVGPSAHPRKAGLRPAGMPYNDDDDDDDMDYNNYDDDHGSGSEDLDMMSHGFDFLGDESVNVYEDFSGDEDENDENAAKGEGSSRRRRSGAAPESQEQPEAQLNPEDEPWPGIEDIMSDGENVDPARLSSSDEAAAVVELNNLGEDAASDVSSQPSEYPSTQRAWHMQEAGFGGGGRRSDPGPGAGFTIHEDDDAGGGPMRW